MKFQDFWIHLRSFWGRVYTEDEFNTPSAEFRVNPDSRRSHDDVCKSQSEKLLFSILETTISGEQMILFLFVGMILGYGIGVFKSRKRRVVGMDYPRQVPRTTPAAQRNTSNTTRSTRSTRRQNNHRSSLTGREDLNGRRHLGRTPHLSSLSDRRHVNYYDSTNIAEYYTPTAPPRTPIPHGYY